LLLPSGSRSSCMACSTWPFEAIAPIVGWSPAAARQPASRATGTATQSAARQLWPRMRLPSPGARASQKRHRQWDHRGHPWATVHRTPVRDAARECDVVADPERLRRLDLVILNE
jgi:hypothetical protein